MADKLFHDLVTLFVVVNPIGVVPLFIAVAGHESAAARRRIAGQAILISTVILFVFIGIGQIVLEALSIDLASFRIAGGLVLLIIALRMVLQEAHDPRGDSSASYDNIAVFPLAMPFIAGSASIMAVVLLTDNPGRAIADHLVPASDSGLRGRCLFCAGDDLAALERAQLFGSDIQAPHTRAAERFRASGGHTGELRQGLAGRVCRHTYGPRRA
jgi:MarC family membrane protein